MRWSVQIHDDRPEAWEISVIREDARECQRYYGWFDDKKLLVSHNGGPCRWPLAPGLWVEMKKLAMKLCLKLNKSQKATG